MLMPYRRVGKRRAGESRYVKIRQHQLIQLNMCACPAKQGKSRAGKSRDKTI